MNSGLQIASGDMHTPCPLSSPIGDTVDMLIVYASRENNNPSESGVPNKYRI